MTLTIGSLFAGYGGLDLGIEAVIDARTAWVSEIDPGACKVLAHRLPHAPNLGDVTTIDWGTVPRVDIIAGGSPCQDLSTAGRRAGMTEGTRSNLWVAMREAIAHIQPTYVIWENVRGAYSATAASDLEPCAGCVGDDSWGGITPLRALGRVLGDLAGLGYDAQWHGLRAADIGAPHGRYRVFLLATRRGAASPAADAYDARPQGSHDPQGAAQARLHGHPVAGADGDAVRLLPTPNTMDSLPPREGEARERQLRRGKGGSRRNATGNLREDIINLLPTPVAQPSGNTPEDHLRKKPGRERVTDLAIIAEHGLLSTTGRLLPTPTTTQRGPDANLATRAGARANLHNEALQLLPTPTCSDHTGAGQHGDGGLDLRTSVALLPTPKASDGIMGLPRTSDRPAERSTFLATRIAYDTPVGADCGIDFGGYAPAVMQWEAALGRPAPSPVEPNSSGKPRLSPRFVEWMMGLPCGWVTDIDDVSRASQLQMLGNGVVPQQAAAALRIMLSRASQEVAA